MSPRARPARGPCLLGFLLLVLSAPPLSAQSASTARATRRPVPGYASLDDWTRLALARLVGFGLADASAASMTWPIRHDRLIGILQAAADSTARPGAVEAAHYLSRYQLDHPGHGGTIGFAASAALRWTAARSALLGGRSTPSIEGFDYSGPRAAPDTTAAGAGLAAAVRVGNDVSVTIELDGDDAGLRLTAAALNVTLGPLDLWAGRRRLRLGAADAGGIVAGGDIAFDGLGAGVPDGFVLPGFLAGAGPVRIDAWLARMERSGDIVSPWFLAQRVSVAPSPAVSFGVNRAAIFGGAGNASITPARLFWMFLGQTDVGGKDSDFENQVVSLDATVRLPAVPLLLWAEYGFDDAGLAFLRVPAIVAGARLVALPGSPGIAVGAEFAWFAGKCCGHPSWYMHGALAEGWTDSGRLLGHPLGGEGVEGAVRWSANVAGGRAVANGRGFVRRRGDDNLFAPARAGISAGGTASLSAALWAFTRAEAVFGAEFGSGWTQTVARIAIVFAR